MTTKEYRIGDEWPNDLPTCIVPWTSITLSANGDIKNLAVSLLLIKN